MDANLIVNPLAARSRRLTRRAGTGFQFRLGLSIVTIWVELAGFSDDAEKSARKVSQSMQKAPLPSLAGLFADCRRLA